MKTVIVLICLTTAAASAQSGRPTAFGSTPAAPANAPAPFTTPPQSASTAVGTTASAGTVSATPGGTGSFVLELTNAFAADTPIAATDSGTNLTIGDLGRQLQTLQANIDQLLPLLAAFNDGFTIVGPQFQSANAGTTTAPGIGADLFGGSTGVNSASLPAQNTAAQLGANFSSNLGVNAGVSLAVPTNPNTSPWGPSTGIGVVPPSPTGVSDPFGTRSGFADTSANTAAGTGTTTAGAGSVSTRDTSRAMLVLQSDLERVLPIISALNGRQVFGPGAAVIEGNNTSTNQLNSGAATQGTPATPGITNSQNGSTNR